VAVLSNVGTTIPLDIVLVHNPGLLQALCIAAEHFRRRSNSSSTDSTDNDTDVWRMIQIQGLTLLGTEANTPENVQASAMEIKQVPISLIRVGACRFWQYTAQKLLHLGANVRELSVGPAHAGKYASFRCDVGKRKDIQCSIR